MALRTDHWHNLNNGTAQLNATQRDDSFTYFSLLLVRRAMNKHALNRNQSDTFQQEHTACEDVIERRLSEINLYFSPNYGIQTLYNDTTKQPWKVQAIMVQAQP